MDMKAVLRAINNAVPVEDGESDYTENGLKMCGKCGTPKQVRVELGGKMATVNCMCRCQLEKAERDEAEKQRLKEESRIAELRRECFSDSKMERWTFDADDGKDARLMKVANAYAVRFDELRAEGKGLLLWGDTGNGKSFAAACIANALIDRGVPCLMTNFARLSNIVNATFQDKQRRIDELDGYELLVIDDLASERDTEYMNEVVFAIIDARYRSGKPLIVTTNLTADELKNPETMHRKRVYSRIMEMCVPVKVEGADRRRAKMGEDYKRISSMLGL